MQRKTLQWLEAKVDAEARTIEGYASTFEQPSNPDAYGDIVAPTAFDNTLQRNLAERRIKIADQHGQPVGVVIEARVDSKGLWTKGRVSETPQGDALLIYAKDGVYGEQSIGFRTIRESRAANGVRQLDEVDLLEVSPCAWGANRNAKITAVKSELALEGGATLEALEALETKATLIGASYALEAIARAKWAVESAVSEMSWGEGLSAELEAAIKGEFEAFKKWLKGQQIGGESA